MKIDNYSSFLQEKAALNAVVKHQEKHLKNVSTLSSLFSKLIGYRHVAKQLINPKNSLFSKVKSLIVYSTKRPGVISKLVVASVVIIIGKKFISKLVKLSAKKQ